MNLGKLRVVENDAGEWYWRIEGRNGEKQGGSAGEGYTSRADAIRGLEAARVTMLLAPILDADGELIGEPLATLSPGEAERL